MSDNPKIVYVDSSQVGGKLGFYWAAPFDTIYLAKGMSPEQEADVLAHEMAHARGDDLGEDPQ